MCSASPQILEARSSEYLAAVAIPNQAHEDKDKYLINRLIQLLRQNFETPMIVKTYASILKLGMNLPAHELQSDPVYVAPRSRLPSILTPLIADNSTTRQLPNATRKSTHSLQLRIRLHGEAAVPDVKEFLKYFLTNVPHNVADIELATIYSPPDQ